MTSFSWWSWITIDVAPQACRPRTWSPRSPRPTDLSRRCRRRRLGTPTVQYGFPDTPLGVWGNAGYSITLLRVPYPESFRLVVASTRLENLPVRRALRRCSRIKPKRLSARSIGRRTKPATWLRRRKKPSPKTKRSSSRNRCTSHYCQIGELEDCHPISTNETVSRIHQSSIWQHSLNLQSSI